MGQKIQEFKNLFPSSGHVTGTGRKWKQAYPGATDAGFIGFGLLVPV